MKIDSAHSPAWADSAGTTIDIVISVEGLDVPLPFSARADDSTAHGRDLFARAASGEFGPVSEYSAPVLPVAEIIRKKTALIDAHILAVLNARGYDGPHSIAKYQNLTDAQIASLPVDERPFATQWRSECQAAALWIVRTYATGLKVLDDVQAGALQAPSDTELLAELPAMVWPEG